MPNIHPMVVHFPVSLIFVVALCDFIGIVWDRRSYIHMGNILSLLAVIGAVVAVISGLMAARTVWHPLQAHEVIETHETLGFVFLGIVAVMTIIRFAVGEKIYGGMKWVGFILSLAASAVIFYSAYLGGDIVFTYGTGVKPAQEAIERDDSLKSEIDMLKGEMGEREHSIDSLESERLDDHH